MSPLTLAQNPSTLLYPASPAVGEEGCVERTLLWAGTMADATWRAVPSESIAAGDSIVNYRPCTVSIVTSPDFLKYFAFIQALIPLRPDLNVARRPNLYQDARQYANSPVPPAGYLA
jgi:hypothetical protein